MMKSSIPVPEKEIKAVTALASEISRLYEELGEDYGHARIDYQWTIHYVQEASGRLEPYQRAGLHGLVDKAKSTARTEGRKLASEMKRKLTLPEGFNLIGLHMGTEYGDAKAIIAAPPGRTYTLNLDTPEEMLVQDEVHVPRFFGRWGTKTVETRYCMPNTSPQPQEASSS